MKPPSFLGLAFLATIALAGPLPVRTYLRNPAFSAVSLSPDGRYVGFVSIIGDKDAHANCFVTELGTKRILKFGLPLPYSGIGPIHVTGLTWLNGHRILITAAAESGTTGAFATDLDGAHQQGLSGFYLQTPGPVLWAAEVLHAFRDDSAAVLLLQRPYRDYKNPTVLKVNTFTGSVNMVAGDYDGVRNWVCDQAGNVRVGICFDGADTHVIYRDDDRAPWTPLPAFTVHGRGGYPVAFDYDGRTAYVLALTAAQTWGIYLYDTVTHARGALVWEDPNYDVISPNDPFHLGELLFSRKKHRLIGVRYLTTTERTVWFDSEMLAAQATLDQMFPGQVNTIMSRSDDETQLLVRSWSDRHPGIYYVFDRRTPQMIKICDSADWIKPELMAETAAIEFRARDGLLIHAYVTYPPGAAKTYLPLVVMPHGGPFLRDAPGFDKLAQFLSGCGYVVLRPNYRGSSGYGEPFSEAGRHEIGKGIQNDITDAVGWAVQSGLADPARLAIVGGSYGGYSVEWALTHTPGLYRCGVSLAGVSDWLSIIKERNRNEDSRDVYRYWKEQIGDPETDEAVLREISPIYAVDRIKVPIFVAHGRADPIVPFEQSRRLVAELKKQGKTYETMFPANEGHTLFAYKNRIELFERIQAFLAANLGPWVESPRPNPDIPPTAAPARAKGSQASNG